MNKHFRVSGSTFRSWKIWESAPLRSSAGLNEAAYLLGYNDANSFVRAFRIWEGVPPARWREEQRAKAAV